MKRDFFRAFLVKDRGEKGRSNPLFPEPKRPLWRKIFVLGALLVSLFGGVYLVIRFTTQDHFYINDLEILGINTLPYADVEKDTNTFLDKRRGLFFKERHRWFLDKPKLKVRLETDFPLKVVDQTVENTLLRVTILEDILMVAVENNGAWTLVGLDGKVIRGMTDEEVAEFNEAPLKRIPKVEIQAAMDVTQTNTYQDKDFFKTVLDLDEGVRLLGLTPERFTLRNANEDWVRLTIEGKSYSLLFDLHRPIPDQLLMLKTVLDEYQGKDGGLSYIDVRFGNHVYVK